jgi:hypothetical protein
VVVLKRKGGLVAQPAPSTEPRVRAR